MTRKFVFSLLLALSIIASTTAVASAQTVINAISLSVYPSSFDFQAKPGDTITDKFRIKNDTNQPLNLTVSVKKLISDKDSGQPEPADPTTQDTYVSWVKFEKPNFTALPQEWTDVPFTIDVPKEAALGYYYVFEIKQQQEAKPSGTGAVVQGRVSIAALLSVESGNTNVTARLINFKADKMLNDYLPVSFTATIQNAGNVHIRPKGNIFIRGLGGKDVGILDVNKINGAILPNGTRSFTADWTDGFLVREPVMEDGKPKVDAKGNPVTKLTPHWNKLTDFRFGKYTANLLMVYDTGKRDATIEASTSFWVIPYVPILILLVGLIIIIFIIRTMLHAYIKRELKRRK